MGNFFIPGEKYVCLHTVASDFPNQNLFDSGNIYECVQSENAQYLCMKDNKSQLRVLFFERDKTNFIPEEYKSFVDDILELKDFKEGRPGFNSFKIPKQIIDNSLTFLGTLIRNNITLKENFSPEIKASNFYTVLFDFYESRVCNEKHRIELAISIEIGKSMLGWFTDWEHGINSESDGTKTDFLTIPEKLLEELKEL